jgi:hypothetical protein
MKETVWNYEMIHVNQDFLKELIILPFHQGRSLFNRRKTYFFLASETST